VPHALLLLSAKVPTGQLLALCPQLVAPSTLYVSPGQATHALLSAKVPAGQAVTHALLLSAKVPTGQLLAVYAQLVAPATLYCSAGHATHALLMLSAKVPAGHFNWQIHCCTVEHVLPSWPGL